MLGLKVFRVYKILGLRLFGFRVFRVWGLRVYGEGFQG